MVAIVAGSRSAMAAARGADTLSSMGHRGCKSATHVNQEERDGETAIEGKVDNQEDLSINYYYYYHYYYY